MNLSQMSVEELLCAKHNLESKISALNNEQMAIKILRICEA